MLRRKILVFVLVTVLTVAGFMVGQAVNAASGDPGTQSDPLVTKSYIDGEVIKLQAKIDSLKVEVDNLKSEVSELEQK